MNFKYITTAFRAEWLKIKGLGLLYMGIAIAAILPLLNLGIHIFVKGSREYDGFPQSAFTSNVMSNYGGFANFFLLIFIIIATSRIAQSDHRNNGWTFMETQPLSKLSIYAGKFLSVVVLSTITMVLFYVFTLFFTTIDELIFPHEALSFEIDLGFILHSFIRIWLLSLGVVSFQMMLSMIFSGFIWPFIIGFLGFVVNIAGEIRQETYDFITYNNILTGATIKNPKALNGFINYTEYLSLFWTVVFFIIGYVIYSRKGIKNAFFKSGKRIAFSLLGLAVIVCGYFFLTQPHHTEKLDGKTIVEGTLKTKKKIEKIHIYESELMNPIAEIPVKNGTFKWETKEKIPFGKYVLDVNRRRNSIYLATGDHIQLDIQMNEKTIDFAQKGTRKAEVEYLKKSSRFSKFYNYTVPEKKWIDEPEKYYEEALEEWIESEKFLVNFRSTENIALSEDFKDYLKQTKAVEMLNTLYDYQKMTSFTDKDFEIPTDFKKELENVIAQPKPILFANRDYKQWKINQFLPKEGTSNPDSIILVKLDAMPKSEEKDRLLSTQMLKILKLTDDKEQRQAFFEKRVNDFKNENYKQFVGTQLMLINNQQKGADFPHFKVVNKEGKTIDLLKQFKGKYIVIDWWATWCGPCKETKPAFEYEAKKYRNDDNLVFVSISVDENKKAWELDTKGDKSHVKHFLLKDKKAMSVLDIQGIPRFMIVDPKGKMYNADLARPGESDFSETLSEFAFSYQSFNVF